MHPVDCLGVSRSYSDAVPARDITLHFRHATAVKGPSGSGKTTLLRLIAGLEIPDRGEIRINGVVVSGPGRHVPPAERGISFMFQSPALWPHMTVAQNIRFGLEDHGGDAARRRVRSLLASLSLEGLEGRHPPQLSGGEARRVALARALAPARPVLLLDEPFQNVDHALKVQMEDVIGSHMDENNPLIIIVSHDGGDRLTQATVYMDRGSARVVA